MECLKLNHLAGMNFAAADFVGARITDVIHRTSLIALLPGSVKKVLQFVIRIVEQKLFLEQITFVGWQVISKA